MAFTYSRSQLLSDINVGIRGKIGMISNQVDFANRLVREVKNEIAINSAKRKQQLTPDLFSGIYEYAAPSDIDAKRLIDIPAQARRYDGSFGIVPVEQFNVNPQPGDVAFDDYNGVRKILINSQVTSPSVVITPFQSVTGWTAVGDAENITLDSDDFIKGNASVSFDISSAGTTTAGLQNSTIDTVDISDYLNSTSSVFVWIKINSATNLTNFILRLGSDSSNYYSKTATTRSDGNAFERGWNLVRFDLSNLTETGTVDDENIEYVSLYMTKTAGKVSETGYKFNYMVLMRGVIHNILYYSRYGWQTSAGAYIENSTNVLDVLVADSTEYDLFVKKGIHLGMQLTNFDMGERDEARRIYEEAKAVYMMQNTDESLVMTSTYHNV